MMHYKLARGTVGETHYGLRLAGVMGFPPTFMETAKSIVDTLAHEARKREKRRLPHEAKVAEQQKFALRAYGLVNSLMDGSWTDKARASRMEEIRQALAEVMKRTEMGYEGAAAASYEADGDENSSRAEDSDIAARNNYGSGMDGLGEGENRSMTGWTGRRSSHECFFLSLSGHWAGIWHLESRLCWNPLLGRAASTDKKLTI